METQIEGEVLKAVYTYDIHVDKDELIRALNDDRRQYEQGYKDAMASIVHCKDCEHCSHSGLCNLYLHFSIEVKPEDFCSYGKRRSTDD